MEPGLAALGLGAVTSHSAWASLKWLSLSRRTEGRAKLSYPVPVPPSVFLSLLLSGLPALLQWPRCHSLGPHEEAEGLNLGERARVGPVMCVCVLCVGKCACENCVSVHTAF